MKHTLKSWLLAGIACSALTACGSSDYSPYGGTQNPTGVKLGKPYSVKGTTYRPEYDPYYEESGKASWYGPNFHGRMTASGEEYDQEEMTAAHRTLPMPSMVRVTRMDTGRSAIVRVNDRGPFAHGRIIDLSKAAARELDMIRDGVASVKVEYLTDETEEYIASLGIDRPSWMGDAPEAPKNLMGAPNEIMVSDLPDLPAPQQPAPPRMEVATYTPPPSAEPQPPQFRWNFVSQAQADVPADSVSGATYRIQTASFSDRRNAENHASRLSGIGSTMVKPVMVNGQTYYRVSLGPIQKSSEARRTLSEVQTLGFTDAKIMVD